MMPLGQMDDTSVPVAFRMEAGVQFVRMSANICGTPPVSRLPTIMPMPFFESFSVATT